MRVLVVEDNQVLAGQLRAALAAAGFAVDAAADGVEAEFLGGTEPYDAVVLDLGLPGMDGLTVLGRWRAAGRTMPVLILTAARRLDRQGGGAECRGGRLPGQAVCHGRADRPAAMR